VEGLDPLAKVPHQYWDDMWLTDALPTPLDLSSGLRVKPVSRHIRDFIVPHIAALGSAPAVVEVGCAGSVWLPYFHELGWRAAGIDYSARGCALARRVLDRASVSVPLHCCDVFAPFPELVGAFDAVVSFGVVEHFLPTSRIIGALSQLIRPGGMVVTMVPNMVGWLGALQKRLNRSIYDLHVPLTPALLAEAHEDAGLEMLESVYVSTADFYVNIAGDSTQGGSIGPRLALKAMRLLSKALWLAENLSVPIRPTARLAPYVGCAARRPL
jgi:2-polyprenyl-3-methyl-5-hydroxy-6-metoxy-1,4-benzoquinol methylase